MVVGNADGNVTSSVAQLVVDTLMKAVPAGTYRINADPASAGHEVVLSTYLIDMFEVRMSYWEEVYEWATQNGYAFTNPGLNTDPSGVPQSGDHPVHSISWYDCVKWANARSEKDGFEPCYYADENRSTVYRSIRVGSGTGPRTRAPVRLAVSTSSAVLLSSASWSYASIRILMLGLLMGLPGVTSFESRRRRSAHALRAC